MPKAIVIEDEQLEHAVRVAKVSSPENGGRDAALLLTCFGTGMTVTEICRLRVSDYLTESGAVLIDSQVRAEIAYNHRSRPLCWTSKKLTNAIDAHLAERLARGHGVSTRVMAFRGLDPDSPLFVSGRTGEGLKISAQRRDGKTYYSANQLSRLYTRLFGLAGIEGASAQSGRRTLAVKLKRRGIDLRHISEILGIESLEAVKNSVPEILRVWATLCGELFNDAYTSIKSMLISIDLKNFKSYERASLPLSAMTFLIGANASGKSNVLEAIRLLNWLAKGSRLDDITRSIQSGDAVVRGQANDLLRDPLVSFSLGGRFEGMPQSWDHFEISIGLVADQLVVTAESVVKQGEAVPLYQIGGLPNSHTDEIRVAYNNFKRGKNKPHIPCSNRQAIFYQLETPGRFESGHQESQRVIPAVTKALRETLRNVVFLDPRPALMRDYAYVKDDLIKEDGSNLSAVLYQISQSSEQKAKLLAFIKSLPEQDITDIEFIKTDRNDVMVRLVESFGQKSRKVDAPLLSDGTLRVLAIGAALLTAPAGALVVIEEIDNGVHPSRAETLVKQLQAIAAERELRVLLTSHNPALMDALPDSALADVVACYRDPEEGDSRLVRLGDLARYPELVAQGPLGQLMTRRVLDRFLKDSTTEEERKAQALDWLAGLRQSTQGGEE